MAKWGELNFTVRKFAEQIDEQLHFCRAKTSPNRASLLRSKNFINNPKGETHERFRTAYKSQSSCFTYYCCMREVDNRKGRGVLVNQIVSSATSIGANIHEANYAASKADFIY